MGAETNELILISANSILSTPDDDRIIKRNDLVDFLLDQFGDNSKRSSLIQDGLATKFYSISPMVWAYYIVCLSKAFVENPNVSVKEIIAIAVGLLIRYIFKVAGFESSSIESIEFLQIPKTCRNKT